MFDLANYSGEAFGLYGKAGGRAGPVKGGLGFNGVFKMVPHFFQQTHMGHSQVQKCHSQIKGLVS